MLCAHCVSFERDNLPPLYPLDEFVAGTFRSVECSYPVINPDLLIICFIGMTKPRSLLYLKKAYICETCLQSGKNEWLF